MFNPLLVVTALFIVAHTASVHVAAISSPLRELGSIPAMQGYVFPAIELGLLWALWKRLNWARYVWVFWVTLSVWKLPLMLFGFKLYQLIHLWSSFPWVISYVVTAGAALSKTMLALTLFSASVRTQFTVEAPQSTLRWFAGIAVFLLLVGGLSLWGGLYFLSTFVEIQDGQLVPAAKTQMLLRQFRQKTLPSLEQTAGFRLPQAGVAIPFSSKKIDEGIKFGYFFRDPYEMVLVSLAPKPASLKEFWDASTFQKNKLEFYKKPSAQRHIAGKTYNADLYGIRKSSISLELIQIEELQLKRGNNSLSLLSFSWKSRSDSARLEQFAQTLIAAPPVKKWTTEEKEEHQISTVFGRSRSSQR